MIIQRLIVVGICSVAVCWVSSCRKDPAIVIPGPPTDTICDTCDTCELYPDYLGWHLGFTIMEDSTHWRMPYFNPNNPDEILYVKEDNANAQMTINTYNLVTEEHYVIYTGSNWGASSIYGAPKWGINDWIIFTLGDENVYKIKSDGTALTQLTSEGVYYFPVFNQTADTFLVQNKAENFKAYMLDLDGNMVDSIDFNIWDVSDWSYSDYLVTIPLEFVQVIDVRDNSLVASYNYPISGKFPGDGGGIMWVNNSTILWSVFPYLFKSDISFNNVEKAKKVCDRMFIRGSINADKSTIVWETYNYTYVDSEHLRLKIQIELMNPVTLQFETLVLP